MKTIAFAVAALALMATTVVPAQAASFGELPKYFNDQGAQVPAFPGAR